MPIVKYRETGTAEAWNRIDKRVVDPELGNLKHENLRS